MNFFLGPEKSIAKLLHSDRGLVTSQGKTAPQKYFFKVVDIVVMDQKEGTEEKKNNRLLTSEILTKTNRPSNYHIFIFRSICQSTNYGSFK